MNIQIREATINDLNSINNIEKTLEHRILSYDLLQATLDKDTYHYFIAICDDTVIGYTAAEHLVDHFDLLSIAVAKEYRGKKIASMLLDKLFNTCNHINVSDIFLEVRCSNFVAIKFYEKNGFEKISTRKNYYADTNEDAYIYLKRLV